MGAVQSVLCGCGKREETLPTGDVKLLCSDFTFDCLPYGVPKLCALYSSLVSVQGLVDGAISSAYASAVASEYRSNPYHNFHHAFGVTQWIFAMFEKSPTIHSTFESSDLLALFAASIAHDVDHPGNNNAFEIATRSELAIQYNDKCVLEKHHAAVGLNIMQQQKCNMFSQEPAKKLGGVRKLFTHAIMMTDMSDHFAMADKLKESSAAFGQSAADRLELAGVVLHAADISNPLLPAFETCKKWAQLITEEFCSQYNKEKELGLPETKMWANVHTPIGFFGSQIGFIDFIIFPFWKALLDRYPDLEKNAELLQNLSSNKEQWKKLKSQAEEGTN